MNKIVIIGSGPSGFLTAFYLYKKYDNIKCYIISRNFDYFHCTYSLFLDHIENTWIYNYFDKSKLFINIMDVSLEFCDGKKIDTNTKYGIINNEYLYNTIFDFLETTNIDFIEGNVYHINKRFNNYNVLYSKNKEYNHIYADFVLQAIGNNKIAEEQNNFNQYYQYFYGVKLQFENEHNFNNCILLNWKKVDNNDMVKSFCYVLPYDKKTLLIEETILSTCKERCYNTLLEKRLFERIKEYNLTNYKIISKEVFKIPLNKPIQNANEKNFSFKIGVCGNMINNLSGYSLGYIIYHIPEYTKYMMDYELSHNYVINKYWNSKRILINNINYLGLQYMEDMSQEELSDFHYNYFKNILNTNNFDIMFLNKDSNISYFSIANSFLNYLYFPKKFFIEISHLIYKNFKNKIYYYYNGS